MKGDSRKIHVGLGDAIVAKNQGILVTYGLGSCVALMLYDPITSIGGMAHILLPKSRSKSTNSHPYKYCETAVPHLLNTLIEEGTKRIHIWAKLVGGSNMFSNLFPEDVINIGMENVRIVRHLLSLRKIKLIAEDTGKNYGRTVYFDLSNGEVMVTSYHAGTKFL